jgi:hypothetical protein
MFDLYEQVLAIECDPSKANAEYSSKTVAYQEGHAAGVLMAAEMIEHAPDCASAAIGFALTLGSEAITFLELWNDGEFDDLRREWPEAPDDIYVGADTLLEPANAA